MFKILSSPANRFDIERGAQDGEESLQQLNAASKMLIGVGTIGGLVLSGLIAWCITIILDIAMGQHNSKMKLEHNYGTIVCVEVATAAHIFNAVRDTVRMLQERREHIPLFGGETPYCSTLFKYTKESFSAENPMAALKHYGPTALSMTAAGLFSAYTMDHSPEMAILHVVLVGTTVKSLDILLGSLAKQVGHRQQAQQLQET